jgi:hypothetical protein
LARVRLLRESQVKQTRHTRTGKRNGGGRQPGLYMSRHGDLGTPPPRSARGLSPLVALPGAKFGLNRGAYATADSASAAAAAMLAQPLVEGDAIAQIGPPFGGLGAAHEARELRVIRPRDVRDQPRAQGLVRDLEALDELVEYRL